VLSGKTVRIVRAAACYCGVVFGIGFILGAIRVSFLEPRPGQRTPELLELPIMLIATEPVGA
jgi:hypothetical protein